MLLLEDRKMPLCYYATDGKTVWQFPREKNGWAKRIEAKGVKVEKLKEVKLMIQTPMFEYIGLPTGETDENGDSK